MTRCQVLWRIIGQTGKKILSTWKLKKDVGLIGKHGNLGIWSKKIYFWKYLWLKYAPNGLKMMKIGQNLCCVTFNAFWIGWIKVLGKLKPIYLMVPYTLLSFFVFSTRKWPIKNQWRHFQGIQAYSINEGDVLSVCIDFQLSKVYCAKLVAFLWLACS